MEAIRSQAQDTTVPLPDVPGACYQAIVRTMQAEEPAQAERIGRGLTTLFTAEILAMAELGVYLVEASDGRGQYYRTTSYTCTCHDARHRGYGCRHSRAIQLMVAASAEADAERQQHEFERRQAMRQQRGA
jgi:hypothetical protein